MSADGQQTVLVVLVVKDGMGWLKATLAALARQTHRRLGVLAVDSGSTDGSAETLEKLLGAKRMLRLPRNVGFPASVAAALGTGVAAEADHVLLLHDDTILADDAVEKLVEAAGATEGVGIVAPKILDAEDRRVLRDVGRGMDRFGYAATPLEDDEIDLGQYDTPREVLFVSSAAMLVSREAWQRAGPPDERLQPAHADLDHCWRVRMAGFRVLMDPRAVAWHRSVGDRGKRRGVRTDRGRYWDERAHLTAILKNYKGLTLLWLLPLYVAQGLGKVALFLLTRNFSHARQVAAAWGWSLLRFPGTLRRRVRAQAARAVPDREVTRFMAPASTRIRRWIGQASSTLFPGRGSALALEEQELEGPPVGDRVRSLLSARPAGVAVVVGTLLSIFAFREALFAAPLEGGSLPIFPESARDLLGRWAQGWVPGGFRGPGVTSPALAPIGLASLLTAGNPRTLAWVLVVLTPVLAGVSAYRAAWSRMRERAPSVVAGLVYAVSAVVLWSASLGSVESIAVVVALPWIASRLARPFERRVDHPVSWAAGTAVGLGIAVAFMPGVWSPLAIVVVLSLLFGGPEGSRAQGIALALAAFAGALILVFPYALDVAAAGAGSRDPGLEVAFSRILRLSPGPAPGGWVAAYFLPAAATLGFALAGRGSRRAAWGAALAGALAIPLAWLAGAGYLPGLADDQVAYLALAASSLSLLVGLGMRSVSAGVERQSFGRRQIAFVSLAILVIGGVGLQVVRASIGGWAVGEDRVPPAYPVVRTADGGAPTRVLWLGTIQSSPFAFPGGQTDGVVEARDASVRYGVTARAGRSALSIGQQGAGPALEQLERALRSILVGRVRHAGSLLSPFGIGFVVAAEDDLPEAAAERLDAQLDLLPAQRAGGLVIYRNTRPLPLASVLPGGTRATAEALDALAPARLPRLGLAGVPASGGGSWAGQTGVAEDGVVLVSAEFDPAWRLRAGDSEIEPFRAFGWAVGFEVPASAGPLSIEREGAGARAAEIAALAILWTLALGLALRRGGS